MSGQLVYLDTETTGLSLELHDIWEVAYAIDDSDIKSFVVTHSLETADPKALEVNGYFDRFPGGANAVPMADLWLRAALTGRFLVGANVAFDAYRLERRWGVAPWHYRMIDVEAYAMPVLGYDRPKGLNGITDDLRGLGYEIPEPDHTAAGDVATVRSVHKALRRRAGLSTEEQP